MYQARPGVTPALADREATFLAACSTTPCTERSTQIARTLASSIREAIDNDSIAPLREAVSLVRAESNVELADLLAAAAFSVEDQLLQAGVPDLRARIRRINCIVREVQYTDQPQSKELASG